MRLTVHSRCTKPGAESLNKAFLLPMVEGVNHEDEIAIIIMKTAMALK